MERSAEVLLALADAAAAGELADMLTAVAQPPRPPPVVKQEPARGPRVPSEAQPPRPADEAGRLRAKVAELEASLRAARVGWKFPHGTGQFPWRGEQYSGLYRGVPHSTPKLGFVEHMLKPHGQGRSHNLRTGTRSTGLWRDGKFIRGRLDFADGRHEPYPIPDTVVQQVDDGPSQVVLHPRALAKVCDGNPHELTITIQEGPRFKCRVHCDFGLTNGLLVDESRRCFVGQVLKLKVVRRAAKLCFNWPPTQSRGVDGCGDCTGKVWNLREFAMPGGWRRVTSASHPHFCIALSPRDRRVTVTYDGWETPLKGEMSDNAVVQLVDAGPMLYADLGGV